MKHTFNTIILLLSLSVSCQACSCISRPLDFDLDLDKPVPLNTLLFFTGSFYDDVLPFIEDEDGNRIKLERVVFNEIKTDREGEQKYLNEILVFRIKNHIKQNVVYTIPNSRAMSGMMETEDDFKFKTGANRAELHTEKLSIKSVSKKYDSLENSTCDHSPISIHAFKMNSELENPYYLIKIRRGFSPIVNTILVKPFNINTIRLYRGPCSNDYFFSPGKRYSIQIAPMNLAGDIGEYSESFSFNAAKPSPLFRAPKPSSSHMINTLPRSVIFVLLLIVAFILLLPVIFTN